jgi:parallel beta-helix repeat protein
VRLGKWRAARFNGRDCWAANVPPDRFVRQIWIGGKRATRARQPNAGYLHVKESPDATEEWQTGQSRFRFDAADVPAGPFSQGAEVILGTRWVESRLPIASVDADQRLVTFLRRSHWRTEPGDPYFLEGDARWLDAPGEWIIDRATHTIYYLPLLGQEMGATVAVTPALSHLLELSGHPEKKQFIDHLTISGLVFAHTEWMLPEPGPATTQPASGGFTQAAIPVPAAVRGTGLRNVVFERCTFRNLGTWAMELGRSTQDCRVSACTFHDLGGGGIKLGDDQRHQSAHDRTRGNEITDCEIADVGRVFDSAVGIWVGQASDNRIAHNHIHDLHYSGISVGWTWGYEESFNINNLVEKNHIHHVGQRSGESAPLLADMGAIYMLGGRAGTIIRDNLIHDVRGLRLGWGIYLDEGCSEVLVEGNLAYRTTDGGFHLHYGRENVVRKNVFAMAERGQQIWRSREEPHLSYTFTHNVVYWTNGTPMTLTGPTNVKFDHNIYGPLSAEQFRAGGMTWEQWRAAGQDVNSRIADPMFVDAEKGDFRFKEGSPVPAIGVEPLDPATVGPRHPVPSPDTPGEG